MCASVQLWHVKDFPHIDVKHDAKITGKVTFVWTDDAGTRHEHPDSQVNIPKGNLDKCITRPTHSTSAYITFTDLHVEGDGCS